MIGTDPHAPVAGVTGVLKGFDLPSGRRGTEHRLPPLSPLAPIFTHTNDTEAVDGDGHEGVGAGDGALPTVSDCTLAAPYQHSALGGGFRPPFFLKPNAAPSRTHPTAPSPGWL